MAKIVNNEIYWEIKEVIDYLNMSRTTFYRETHQRLHPQTFDGRAKPWYKREEVIALAEGRLEERPHIVIKGLLTHWTRYAESLGLNVETINCEIEIGVPLPIEVCTQFHIPERSVFVRRKRLTFIDRIPICFWSTFYPFNLVGSFLDQIKQDTDFDIPAAITQSRGLRAARATDSIRAREASIPEQELLQLSRPSTIINLQRAARSEQGLLLHFSDMILLSSWFRPEYSYSITED